MSYAVDTLIIIFWFAVFGAVHSFLASNYIKKLIIKEVGNYIAFYRLVYNILALYTFYLIYENVPHPQLLIYDLPSPFDIIILIPWMLSIIGLVYTSRFFCMKEFIGYSQIKRFIKGEYSVDDLDEQSTFRKDGPYKFSRHPLYVFAILFLIFRPQMILFDLIFTLCMIAYFYIGSYYEEKKLIEKFGDEYIEYQKNTPRIFPLNFSKV